MWEEGGYEHPLIDSDRHGLAVSLTLMQQDWYTENLPSSTSSLPLLYMRWHCGPGVECECRALIRSAYSITWCHQLKPSREKSPTILTFDLFIKEYSLFRAMSVGLRLKKSKLKNWTENIWCLAKCEDLSVKKRDVSITWMFTHPLLWQQGCCDAQSHPLCAERM